MLAFQLPVTQAKIIVPHSGYNLYRHRLKKSDKIQKNSFLLIISNNLPIVSPIGFTYLALIVKMAVYILDVERRFRLIIHLKTSFNLCINMSMLTMQSLFTFTCRFASERVHAVAVQSIRCNYRIKLRRGIMFCWRIFKITKKYDTTDNSIIGLLSYNQQIK